MAVGFRTVTRWLRDGWIDTGPRWWRRPVGTPAAAPSRAEDIAQEALWAAYQRRDRLVDPAGERAWLLAFVGNEGRAAATRVSDDDHSNSAPEIAWPLTSVAAAERRSVSPAETVAESGVTARATAT